MVFKERDSNMIAYDGGSQTNASFVTEGTKFSVVKSDDGEMVTGI